MGEFDENHTEPSAEVHLLARMKLQRVVFGAFAIVLISLFALGLSAYRKMQRDATDAENARTEAQQLRDIAIGERDAIERKLGKTGNELRDTRAALALEKARLAIHEVRDGQAGRARELIAESARLGPPPWLPLATRLTEDSAVRFTGSDHAGQPILCGALSGDRRTLAVARRLPDYQLLLEFYDVDSGKLIDESMLNLEIEPDPGIRLHLLLDRDGRRFFLRAPGRSVAGERGGRTIAMGAESDMAGGLDLPRFIDASPDLELVYEVTSAGIVIRRRIPGGRYTREIVDVGVTGETIHACIAAGERLVFAASDSVYSSDYGGEPTVLYRFNSEPEHVALHRGAGPVFAAAASGDAIDLVSIEFDGLATASRHLAPEEPIDRLQFLADDSLVWVGSSGRVLVAEFGDRRARILGDTVPTFIERHPQGLVFANRKGELNVRVNEDSPLLGRSLQVIPPGWSGEPQAHGFAVTGKTGEQFVQIDGRWQSVAAGARIALTPLGPAWSSDRLRLPDGGLVDDRGILIGGFSDGGVLLFAGGGKLRCIGREGVPEVLLPSELAPDAVSIAAQARVAALRMRDSIFVTDFHDEPRAVPNSMQVAPDLLALDATGRYLAVAYGPTISVRETDGAEEFVRTATPPREIALLFGGSVLVTVEGGELVFYEVGLGRELVRVGEDVTAIESSGEAALNIVAGGRLRKLDLKSSE